MVKVNQRGILEDCLLEIANDSSYLAVVPPRLLLTWVTRSNSRDLDSVTRTVPLLHHNIHWPEEGAVSQEKELNPPKNRTGP